jgi:CRISPR-associated endonuclease Cas2
MSHLSFGSRSRARRAREGAFVAIAYDVVSNSRRTKLRRALKGLAWPVQYSVFETVLDSAGRAKLERIMVKHLKQDVDRARCYFLCESCRARIVSYGSGEPIVIESLIL